MVNATVGLMRRCHETMILCNSFFFKVEVHAKYLQTSQTNITHRPNQLLCPHGTRP